jgi:phage terminase large subunit-like protein
MRAAARSRTNLVAAIVVTRRLVDVTERRALDRVRWTPPQHAFLSDSAPRKLLRAGNQIGKTWAGMAEVIWRAMGTHPFYRTHTPPIEAWIVCTSWAQSVAIMKKFRALCPPDAIRRTRFDPRTGYGKDNPAVVFLNGSIVRFRTTNQGAEALAGATVHFVLIDEPTDEENYRELDRRLLRTAGAMALTLTPINRPVEYLRDLAELGLVTDHHARLTATNLTPLGMREPLRLLDGTPMDEAWIAEQRRLVLPRYAPVVLDGEWECRTEGAVFTAFDPAVHRTERVPDIDLKALLGIDYGQRDFKQVAELAGVDLTGEYPHVHVLDEYVAEGDTTPDQDATAIVELLGRDRGWTWRDLDFAHGDKPYDGAGSRRRVIRKSNADLQGELEKVLRRRGQLGKRVPLTPPIRQAKTGPNGGRASIDRGCTWLHRAMLRPGHFTVHPRCERLIEALQKWDFTDNDYKDPIDALRYATWPYAMRGSPRANGRTSIYLYGG